MLTLSGRHNSRQIFCNVVLTPVPVLDGFDSGLSKYAPKLQVLKALIDTGATDTNVSPAAAEKLALEPMGLRDVNTAAGIIPRPFYLFHVGFLNDANKPSEMVIPSKPIEGMELLHDNFGFDVLLGMDVISQGQLTITQRRFEFTLSSANALL